MQNRGKGKYVQKTKLSYYRHEGLNLKKKQMMTTVSFKLTAREWKEYME